MIFDSSVPIGKGQGVYVLGVARELPAHETAEGIEIFSKRSVGHGGSEWSVEDVSPPARHRLYQATAEAHYVLDEHDHRVEVSLKAVVARELGGPEVLSFRKSSDRSRFRPRCWSGSTRSASTRSTGRLAATAATRGRWGAAVHPWLGCRGGGRGDGRPRHALRRRRSRSSACPGSRGLPGDTPSTSPRPGASSRAPRMPSPTSRRAACRSPGSPPGSRSSTSPGWGRATGS